MKTIYNTIITDIGPLAPDFYGEKMMILFKDNAPEDLAEYCILHNLNELTDTIKPDDTLIIGDKEYKVTAVGDVVYKNLKDLGHICIRFDGSTSAGLDGSLYVEDKEMNLNIKKGTKIQIIR